MYEDKGGFKSKEQPLYSDCSFIANAHGMAYSLLIKTALAYYGTTVKV